MTIEEVRQVRDKIRENLESQIKNKNQKIGKIVYYADFEMFNSAEQKFNYAENDVFIVTREIKGQNGATEKIYDLYDGKGTLLARTDSKGELAYTAEYINKLKLLSGELYKGIGIEERKHYLSREGEFAITDKPYEQLNEKEREDLATKIEENKKEESTTEKDGDKVKKLDEPEQALIEDDLGLDRGSNTHYVEITDKRFYDIIPEAKKYEGNAMLVYSEKTNQYVIGGIDKKTGKFEPCDRILQSFNSSENMLDLSANKDFVEEKGIDKYMRVGGEPNFAFAVDINMVGNDPLKLVRINRLEDGTIKYMASDIETTREWRPPKNIENIMSKDKNTTIEDEVEAFDKEKVEAQVPITKIDPKTRNNENKQGDDGLEDGEPVHTHEHIHRHV